jgi:hypothetical protein
VNNKTGSHRTFKNGKVYEVSKDGYFAVEIWIAKDIYEDYSIRRENSAANSKLAEILIGEDDIDIFEFARLRGNKDRPRFDFENIGKLRPDESDKILVRIVARAI